MKIVIFGATGFSGQAILKLALSKSPCLCAMHQPSPFNLMMWLKVIIDDKNRMESIIMNSELDWTIVRCPNIVDKTPKGNVHATLDGKDLKLAITLGDMAEFMIQQVNDSDYSKHAPCISN